MDPQADHGERNAADGINERDDYLNRRNALVEVGKESDKSWQLHEHSQVVEVESYRLFPDGGYVGVYEVGTDGKLVAVCVDQFIARVEG